MFVAEDGELRISGQQQVCFPLKEHLRLKGVSTGEPEVTHPHTDALYSTVEFEATGKSRDDVLELIKSFLLEKQVRFSMTIIPNLPHGFEVFFRLVNVSVFRPH